MDSKEKLIKLIEENKMDGTIGVARSYREFGREFIYNILKDIERMDSTLFLLDEKIIKDNLFRTFRMLEEGFLAGITRKNGLRRQAADLLIKSIEESTATGSKYGQYFKEYLDEIEEALGEQGRSFFEKRSDILRRMIKMANHLDSKGLSKEADYLDKIILKFSQEKKSKEEYEDYAFKILSKMLTHMAKEKIVVSRENLPIKLEAKPARALFSDFMGHRSFPETNSSIKNLDPSIMNLSFNDSKHEMTVEIVVDMINPNTPEDYSLVTYEAVVTPNFVESKDKSKFVDSANVTITINENKQ